jgi:hypothetical protein
MVSWISGYPGLWFLKQFPKCPVIMGNCFLQRSLLLFVNPDNCWLKLKTLSWMSGYGQWFVDSGQKDVWLSLTMGFFIAVRECPLPLVCFSWSMVFVCDLADVWVCAGLYKFSLKSIRANLPIFHMHCKETIAKIRNNYSQKRNCGYSPNFPSPTLMFLWALLYIHIFPWSVCLFCCRKIGGPNVGIYVDRSQAHECGHWDLRPRNSFTGNT